MEVLDGSEEVLVEVLSDLVDFISTDPRRTLVKDLLVLLQVLLALQNVVLLK